MRFLDGLRERYMDPFLATAGPAFHEGFCRYHRAFYRSSLLNPLFARLVDVGMPGIEKREKSVG